MKKRQHLKYRLGAFTMVELLIVISMVAVIGLAIYGILSGGIRIWQRVGMMAQEEDSAIFFDKLSTDIRNIENFGDSPFVGGDGKFECQTLVDSQKLGFRAPGRVKYFFDGSVKALRREEADYSDVHTGDAGLSTVALENVNSGRFSYYIYDEEKKEYRWDDESSGGALPLAVRIDMEIENGGHTRKYIKTISIPAGG